MFSPSRISRDFFLLLFVFILTPSGFLYALVRSRSTSDLFFFTNFLSLIHVVARGGLPTFISKRGEKEKMFHITINICLLGSKHGEFPLI